MFLTLSSMFYLIKMTVSQLSCVYISLLPHFGQIIQWDWSCNGNQNLSESSIVRELQVLNLLAAWWKASPLFHGAELWTEVVSDLICQKCCWMDFIWLTGFNAICVSKHRKVTEVGDRCCTWNNLVLTKLIKCS